MMGVGQDMNRRSKFHAASAARYCLVLSITLALAASGSLGVAEAGDRRHRSHHAIPKHHAQPPKPEVPKARPPPAPPHAHHRAPGHRDARADPQPHRSEAQPPPTSGEMRRDPGPPAHSHQHSRAHRDTDGDTKRRERRESNGDQRPPGEQHARLPRHARPHAGQHFHAPSRPRSHYSHGEHSNARPSPQRTWRAHQERRAHELRDRLKHGTRHRQERKKKEAEAKAAQAPAKQPAAATQPKRAATLPALQSPQAPAAGPSDQPAAAHAKTVETTSREVSDAVEGPAMRLGAPRDADDEPEARSLVRSAAEKARAAREERGLRPLVSLGSGVPPLVGTYRKQEILTGRLPPEIRRGLAKYELDIKDGPVAGVTKVVLPPRQDAWEILRGLEKEFPKQGWALNYLYRPYRPEVEDAPYVVPIPPNPSVGCSTERCYARKNWADSLAACAEGVKVGVIDTGYDAEHPALKKANARLVLGSNDNPKARKWHGTAVLALLAGVADSSTPGFIPNAEFLVANVFYEVGGEMQTDTLRLVEALERLKDAHIINMSLVGPRDDLLRDRIADLSRHRGTIFIAAAGNGGETAPAAYPAAYPHVIAVAAVDSKGRGYRHGNRGDYIDVAAPGVGIWTAWPGRSEAMVTGTSFAAPFVTALAAVSYHQNPLKAAIEAGLRTFDPKKETLAGFDIKKVETGEQRRMLGEGLIRPPSGCTPRQPQSWAAKVNRRASLQGAWSAEISPRPYQRATQ
jgi:subtilisin family serine protease